MIPPVNDVLIVIISHVGISYPLVKWCKHDPRPGRLFGWEVRLTLIGGGLCSPGVDTARYHHVHLSISHLYLSRGYLSNVSASSLCHQCTSQRTGQRRGSPNKVTVRLVYRVWIVYILIFILYIDSILIMVRAVWIQR